MKIVPIPSVKKSPSRFLKEAESIFAPTRRLQVPVWVFDIDTQRILFANSSACNLWQAKSEKELRLRNLSADISSTVISRLKQYQNSFIEDDAEFTEQWTLYPNGTPKCVTMIFRGFPLANGAMAMQCEAVSEANQAPQNLRSTEAVLFTDVMISLFSFDGHPLYLNPAAHNAFRMPINSLEDVIVEKDVAAHLLTQVEVVGDYKVVTKVHTSEGQKWFDLSAKTCADAATGKPAFLLTASDVSELKLARDTARRLADRDQLTNLHNRASAQRFYSKLAKKYDADGCAAVFFDVDRFKLINDRHGHEAGDVVLQHIAKQCLAVVGEDEIVARLGGDEFVIIITGVGKRAVLDARIAELRLSISRPVFHEQTQIDVETSIGVATFSPHDSTFDDVLRKADIALYSSKNAGRNQATYFTEDMGIAVKARDQIETELKQALKKNEFVLHYQPRLDIATNTVVGVEGLVRWEHPDRGLIMPNDFIAICEETGMIDELGRMVLGMGCTQAIKWHAEGKKLEVSVNVSPRQFSDKALLSTLTHFARLPGFPTGRVELEITENALIGDHDAIAEKLKVITALGYRIAIDDFGSGYSNLSYISRFPLSCLKIDRSFIDQLPASGPIVRLILTLGNQLGATVVSEGIENQEQLKWLEKHHCDQAQGYLIARPLPLSEFETFLKDWTA